MRVCVSVCVCIVCVCMCMYSCMYAVWTLHICMLPCTLYNEIGQLPAMNNLYRTFDSLSLTHTHRTTPYQCCKTCRVEIEAATITSHGREIEHQLYIVCWNGSVIPDSNV